MNTNGIGLGLVIAKQIANVFDGDITFVSEFQVGSTFTFTFKLENDDSIDEEEDDLSD